MVFDRNKPFNELPLLPPETDLGSKTVLKRAIAATVRQTRLKIFRIRDAMNAVQELARTKAPKIYSKVLIDNLLRQTKVHRPMQPAQLDLFADFNGTSEGIDKTEFCWHNRTGATA